MPRDLTVLKGEGVPAVRCAISACGKRIAMSNLGIVAIRVDDDTVICTTCLNDILEACKRWSVEGLNELSHTT